MGWFPRKTFFRIVRIVIAILFIIWGIVGSLPPLMWLPGGIWTILLGMALLSFEIPWVKKLDDRLLAWVERKFPKIYIRIILPTRRIGDKIAERIRSFLS